ncbi:hypothetical protein Tco_0814508 [Tanacetum coccineum]
MKSSRKSTDLTANTPYYSRPIRRIQDFDESKDHCLTLKNTPYPHQQYAVCNTLVNDGEHVGFTQYAVSIKEDTAREDEIAKEIIANDGVPITTKEHDSVVSKIKKKAAEAHVKKWVLKEKSLKQKIMDQIAKAIIANDSVPITTKEYDLVVSELKKKAAEAHAATTSIYNKIEMKSAISGTLTGRGDRLIEG